MLKYVEQAFRNILSSGQMSKSYGKKLEKYLLIVG